MLVIQMVSIQGGLKISRSLNWERIARDQKAVTSFSFLYRLIIGTRHRLVLYEISQGVNIKQTLSFKIRRL